MDHLPRAIRLREDLAFVALIVILFRDGLEVEGEMLQSAWHLPLRKLAIAMPLTAGIVAVAAHLLIGLSWTESLLLGALLSPTDPVLTSNIVTNPRVPRLIRHSLNLESGLNDGLALPAVLTFLAALSTESQHFVWWRFVLQDVGLGLLAARPWVARLMVDAERESSSLGAPDPLPPEVSVCARGGVRHLRPHRARAARERLYRGVRRGDRARRAPP